MLSRNPEQLFKDASKILREQGIFCMLDFLIILLRIRFIFFNLIFCNWYGFLNLRRIAYGSYYIAEYDKNELLVKLRLFPSYPKEFYGRVRWDWRLKRKERK